MSLNEGTNPEETPTGFLRKGGSNVCGNPERLDPTKRLKNNVKLGSAQNRPALTVIPGVEREPAPLVERSQEEWMAMVADYEANMTTMGLELEGMRLQNRQAVRRIAEQARQINDIQEVDPKADDIREVVEYWKMRLGHPKTRFSIHDSRADAVRNALKFRDKEDLLLAIDGLALLPYVGEKGRTSNPLAPGAERHDRIGIALGANGRLKCKVDVEAIDRFASYANRAAAAAENTPERLWAKYQELEAQAMAYRDMLMAALRKKENGGLDPFEQASMDFGV
jgi:hypothetical protein